MSLDLSAYELLHGAADWIRNEDLPVGAERQIVRLSEFTDSIARSARSGNHPACAIEAEDLSRVSADHQKVLPV